MGGELEELCKLQRGSRGESKKKKKKKKRSWWEAKEQEFCRSRRGEGKDNKDVQRRSNATKRTEEIDYKLNLEGRNGILD